MSSMTNGIIPLQDQVSAKIQELRSFTTTFLTRLPREIRDIVYGYLWDSYRRVSPYEKDPSKFMHPELVSPDFAREAVTYMYQHLDHESYAEEEDLKVEMTKDVFGIGITRLDFEVKTLSVQMYLGEEVYDKVREQLPFLTQIRVTKASKINIKLSHRDSFKLQELYDIFQAFKPVFVHFEKLGVEFKVVWNYFGVWGGPLGDRLDWSMEQWHEIILHVLSRMDGLYHRMAREHLAQSLGVPDPFAEDRDDDEFDDDDCEDDHGDAEGSQDGQCEQDEGDVDAAWVMGGPLWAATSSRVDQDGYVLEDGEDGHLP
ncbi:hypothetical protein BDV96DRAFT_649358 [Lophiotrema nucula]|uniref:Uncharacterized protein n=1 Tax=Lophiotrema nucula TaxID=690887 RepID=A0A6A5YYU9_9PLEO|nr:hypothetical protein BDV96DRAFT_649358 [Lophiotrema nucula]